MNEHQQTLLAHLRAALFGGAPGPEVTGEVIDEALAQHVHTLLPIEGYREYWQWVGRNVSVTVEHQELHAIMEKGGVPYAVLKGAASAAYYPDPDRRPMGDVDFIVRQEDVPRARAALEAEGFTMARRIDKHEEYHRGESRWELHTQPPGFPESCAEVCSAGEIISHAVMGKECMTPSAYHHGLILLAHNAEHMLEGGIGLRHVCDWVVYAASFTDEAFRDMLEGTLKEIGLWRYAQVLTQLGVRYLGAPERAWAAPADEGLLEALLQDVLDGGDFGLKDENRVLEANMLQSAAKGKLKEGGELTQVFRSAAEVACSYWPVMRRVKVLLPFGAGWLLLRRLVRMATGQRKAVHLGEAMEGAKKRKAIYRECALFEPEK